jgi:hypothetical protein
MLRYNMRMVEIKPFDCLHDPILKNVQICNLCHLPPYIAHVIHAIGSHTYPHKTCTTFMFNYLTQMMSSQLRFSILCPTPSTAIRLNRLILGSPLKSTLYQSWIVWSWCYWANSNLEKTFLAVRNDFICCSNDPRPASWNTCLIMLALTQSIPHVYIII